MSLKVIRNILNTHMSDLNTEWGSITSTFGEIEVTFGEGVPSPYLADIAWENVAFTPTTNNLHIRVNFAPVESIATARFKSAMVMERGFYQIDVYAPQGLGTSPIDEVVESIRYHFNRGRTLTDANGNKVHIKETPRTSQGRREAGFYRVTIFVDWFAYFTQP